MGQRKGYKRSLETRLKHSQTLRERGVYQLPGEKNPNFKNGKYCNNRCPKCDVRISPKAKHCNKCRNRSGEMNPAFGKHYNKVYSKRCYYKDICFRSTYEMKYALYLDKNDVKWTFENVKFEIFDSRGEKLTYSPDFYLTDSNEYIEIKGYWYPKNLEKFNLFKEQYPNIKITVLMLEDLKKLGVL